MMENNIVQDVERIKQLWDVGLPDKPVVQSQIVMWVSRHGYDAVKRAVEKTLRKNAAMNGQMTQDHAVRYASKVMENRKPVGKSEVLGMLANAGEQQEEQQA